MNEENKGCVKIMDGMKEKFASKVILIDLEGGFKT